MRNVIVLLIAFTALGAAERGRQRNPPPPPHQEPPPGDAKQELERGYASGVVVEIDAAKPSFTVRAKDGSARTFVPRWIGGKPENGGGLDRDISQRIRELRIDDVVDVGWERDERLRALKIRVTKPGPGHDAPDEDEARREGPVAERLDAPPPDEDDGTTCGRILEVDAKGRLVLADEKGKPQCYVPRWVGGMPADGGGFERAMVTEIGRLQPGQTVEVTWIWDERRRITALHMVDDR